MTTAKQLPSGGSVMDGLGVTAACREPLVAARAALVAGTGVLTYADLARRVARLRAGSPLRHAAPGSRVALMASSRVETVVAIHALLELGAVLVPIPPRLTPPEVARLLDDAAPDLVLADADLEDPTGAPPSVAPPVAELSPEAPLAILFTSGTTGRSKGAVLSRGAFLAAAAASARNLGWKDDDRWLVCMPLCHVGGLSILTRCLLARRTVVLLPRFEPGGVLEAIARDRCTLLSVVPTMLRALLDEDRSGLLRRLRAVLVGGAAAPFPLLEECARRGVRALATYGLTEACSQVASQRPSEPPLAERGCGWPLVDGTLRIAGAGAEAAGSGEVGRILVRGATLMGGYWRGPGQALDPAVDAAGWFDTGDLGSLDDAGRLFVHARRTDLIVTGGENVYPAEVEQALEAMPGVRRALVFGVPDERWGQVVAAAIERDQGDGMTEGWEAMAMALAPHKRPRRVCVVPSLPLTASGKVDRSGACARYGELLGPWPKLRP